MGRSLVSCDRWIIGLLAMGFVLLAGQAYADESNEKKPDDTKPREVLDCRYQQSDGGEIASEWFPPGDLFRPLLADPKQPQWFALWQSTQLRNERSNANIGSVAIGENFGFYTRRKGCNGWQIGLLTGIFAQFDLDTSEAALVNIDFNVGIPLTWRQGNWSARLRFYHQSSHVGDEFLMANPGFQSIGLLYNEVDMIVSYDFQRWLRLYGGGAVMVHREPSTIDRNRVQWGFEARGPSKPTHMLGSLLDKLIITPVLTADFNSLEEQDWIINTNMLCGLEWSRTGSFRRLRILFNYYHGYNPYGQFFYSQKTESFGAGAYFMF